MSDLDRADIGEFLLIATAARDSGFKRVEIEPDHVIALCDRIRTLEAELAEARKENDLAQDLVTLLGDRRHGLALYAGVRRGSFGWVALWPDTDGKSTFSTVNALPTLSELLREVIKRERRFQGLPVDEKGPTDET